MEKIINILCYTRITFSEPIFSLTKFGRPVLTLGEHRYNLHNRCIIEDGTKVQWICSKKNGGCRASIFTIDNYIIYKKNEHIH